MLHIDTYMMANEAASKRPLISTIFALSIYSAAFQVSKMQKPVALSAARAERCAESEMAIKLLTFALAASTRPESESRAWDFRTESAGTTESQTPLHDANMVFIECQWGNHGIEGRARRFQRRSAGQSQSTLARISCVFPGCRQLSRIARCARSRSTVRSGGPTRTASPRRCHCSSSTPYPIPIPHTRCYYCHSSSSTPYPMGYGDTVQFAPWTPVPVPSPGPGRAGPNAAMIGRPGAILRTNAGVILRTSADSHPPP